MKKYPFVMAVMLALLTSCSYATPDNNQEAVLIPQPWIFGHGGILDTPVLTGREVVAWTTKVIYVYVAPVKYEEAFDVILASDNTALNVLSNLTLSVKIGKSPILIKNYGEDWYANSISPVYRGIVRDVLSQYSYLDLMGERGKINEAQDIIRERITNYILEKSQTLELPINVENVSTGHVTPPKYVMDEMERTAAEKQKLETTKHALETKMTENEIQRLDAEGTKGAKGILGCTMSDYVNYMNAKTIDKQDNINVVLAPEGGGTLINVPARSRK